MTGLFVSTTPQLLLNSGNYALTEFAWNRTRSNNVGAFSYFNATPSRGPGSQADYQGAFTLAATPVPEPATWALMILGFGAVGVAVRARRTPSRAAAIA